MPATACFRKLTDEFVKSLQGNTLNGWYGTYGGAIGHPDYNNLRSGNEVIRCSIHASPRISFETGFY